MGDTLTLMYSFIMKIKIHILIYHCLLFTHIEVYKKRSFYPVNIKTGIYNASHLTYNDKTLQSRLKIEWSIRLEQKINISAHKFCQRTHAVLRLLKYLFVNSKQQIIIQGKKDYVLLTPIN